MTVQGILPTGPSAVGQVPSRGKAKTESSQADSAFASLLAALVAPGTTPLPGLLPLPEGSEGQAVPAPAPAAPTAPTAVSLTPVSLSAAAVPLPVANPAGAQGAAAEAPESGVPLHAQTAPPPLVAAAPALPATPGPAPAPGRQPQPGAAAADSAAPGSPLPPSPARRRSTRCPSRPKP